MICARRGDRSEWQGEAPAEPSWAGDALPMPDRDHPTLHGASRSGHAAGGRLGVRARQRRFPQHESGTGVPHSTALRAPGARPGGRLGARARQRRFPAWPAPSSLGTYTPRPPQRVDIKLNNGEFLAKYGKTKTMNSIRLVNYRRAYCSFDTGSLSLVN
jgi:hypothetical protein